MSDDEEPRGSMGAVDVSFVADDTTVEVPHPKRLVFLTPATGMSDGQFEAAMSDRMRFFTLPHPRAGSDMAMCVCPTSTNNDELCFIQRHRQSEFSAWLIDSNVEPDGSLNLALPFDLVFLAMWTLLRQAKEPIDAAQALRWLDDESCRPGLTFRDLPTLLVEEPRLRPIDQFGFTSAFSAAMRQISDVTRVDDDEYYRLSIAKTASLLKTRFEALLASSTLRNVVYPPRREDPAPRFPTVERASPKRGKTTREEGDALESQPSRAQPTAESPSSPTSAVDLSSELAAVSDASPEQRSPTDASGASAPPPAAATTNDTFLPLRALHLLLDFVPAVLHDAVAKHCGVQLDTSVSSARTMANRAAQQSLAEYEENVALGITPEPAKRNRSETFGSNAKSQSVKKLEKAGPPKGTPSIMSMFKKK